jgi:hypothetical protein
VGVRSVATGPEPPPQPPSPWLQEEAEITVESLELRFALFEQRSALEMLDG